MKKWDLSESKVMGFWMGEAVVAARLVVSVGNFDSISCGASWEDCGLCFMNHLRQPFLSVTENKFIYNFVLKLNFQMKYLNLLYIKII